MNPKKINQNRNSRVVGYMLVAVGFSSLIPIFIHIGNANVAPLLFVAIMLFVAGITEAAYLCIFYRRLAFNADVLKLIMPRLGAKEMWGAFIGRLIAYPSFALSLKYIDVSVSIIIFETWPIFLIFIAALGFKKILRYRELTGDLLVLAIWGFIGFIFVSLSQYEHDVNITAGETMLESPYQIAWGVIIVLVGAATSAFAPPCNLAWGKKINDAYKCQQDDRLFFVMTGSFLSLVSAGIILTILGIFIENIPNGNYLMMCIYAGIVAGFGGILFRYAIMRTDNLGISALSYIKPVASLILLWGLSFIDVPKKDYLLIGACAVFIANCLINFEADIRLAYKSLIISLWGFGAFVYLYDAHEILSYLEFIGVASTMFVVLLSFRTDRLVRRTEAEEKSVLSLFQKIKALKDTGFLCYNGINYTVKILACLRLIDAPKTPAILQNAYHQIKEMMANIRKNAAQDKNTLTAIESEIDTLVHSKQQAVNFGELLALGILTLLIIVGAIFFTLKDVAGWSEVFFKTFAFLIASSVVFLFFNIIDLQNDRNRSIFAKIKGKMHGAINFRDAQNRNFERWTSAVICLLITVAYVVLLANKHFNWF